MNRTPLPRRARVHPLFVLALAAVLGVSGYLVVTRWAGIRAFFARDTEDAAEMGRLSGAKLAPPPPADPSAGWPQWRGPTRDGRAPAGPLHTDWEANPPKRLWTFECGGGYSSCVVAGGKLYTQDRQGGNERVFCLDASNGDLLWEYGYPAGEAGRDRNFSIGPRATPAVEGGRVYAVGGAGKFLCLEAPATRGGNPTVRWEHDLLAGFGGEMPQWGVACSPLVEGDLVVVQPGGEKGSVAAFDKETGELRWAAGENEPGYSSPVAVTVGGQRTILALTGEALLAVTTDGKVTDTYDWRTNHKGNIVTPLVVDDWVFISSAYGMGCALLRAEERGAGVKLVPVYSRRRGGFENHHATSVFKDRFLYGFDGDSGSARLRCVEFDTGKPRPGWEADGIEKGNLILAGKHLLIQSQTGHLYVVEATPEEFRLVAELRGVLSGKNNWATPALVDGRLYLRDEQKVVCYDVR